MIQDTAVMQTLCTVIVSTQVVMDYRWMVAGQWQHLPPPAKIIRNLVSLQAAAAAAAYDVSLRASSYS